MEASNLRPATIQLENFKNASSIQPNSINIIGFPFDGTACFKKGARFGPDNIREHLEHIETFSPYLNQDLEDYKHFVDLGNLVYNEDEIEYDDVEHIHRIWKKSLNTFNKLTKNVQLKNDHIKLLSLGGEHSVSINPISFYLSQYNNLVLLHLDAHADLRAEWEGFEYSHASIIQNCLKHFGPEHKLIQYGIRSGTKDEYKWMRDNKTLLDHIDKIIDIIKCLPDTQPIYLSLDLDFLDPSVLSGTGTPEPGGESFNNLVKILKSLQSKNLVGADIVELAPNIDPSGVSSIVATKVFREILLLLSSKPL